MKGFAEEQVISSEWKTERVREGESGDSEEGEVCTELEYCQLHC